MKYRECMDSYTPDSVWFYYFVASQANMVKVYSGQKFQSLYVRKNAADQVQTRTICHVTNAFLFLLFFLNVIKQHYCLLMFFLYVIKQTTIPFGCAYWHFPTTFFEIDVLNIKIFISWYI